MLNNLLFVDLESQTADPHLEVTIGAVGAGVFLYHFVCIKVSIHTTCIFYHLIS